MEPRGSEAERNGARENGPTNEKADAVRTAAGEGQQAAPATEAAHERVTGLTAAAYTSEPEGAEEDNQNSEVVNSERVNSEVVNSEIVNREGRQPSFVNSQFTIHNSQNNNSQNNNSQFGHSAPYVPKGEDAAEPVLATESEGWQGESEEDEEALDSDAYFYATDYDPQQEAIKKLEAEERLAEAIKEQERKARIEAVERARQEAEESARVYTDVSTAVGKLRRISSLSISVDLPTAAAAAPAEAPQQQTLTLALLEGYWESMLGAMREQYPQLAEHLGVAKLEWVDEDNFVIVVQSSFAESEVRPYLVRILTYLRRKSARGLLNATIKVVHVERKTVAYMPQEKFDLMASTNPVLNTFRVIFPEVDY
ncbi:MAG: hypothetical protein MJZ77_08815 [Bacteroidales bacterium]|nr:hypothetical protein [Bacteroidales bacterium]